MTINYKQRQEIYSKVFSFMLEQNLHFIPTPLEAICHRLGIGLKPLSEFVNRGGLTEEQVFRIWGNENGHLMPYIQNGRVVDCVIAYNDSEAHKDRKRFTISEEITHFILGHYLHEMYRVFNPPLWDESLYQFHEKTARIGAGILVCPPPIFYNVPAYFNTNDIQYLCEISRPCATARYNVLTKYKYEIMANGKYKEIVNNYEYYIDSLPCPRCGSSPIARRSGVCSSCELQLLGDLAYY